MTLIFEKYQGSGNDFIFFDNRDGALSLTNKQIQRICDRHFGIGGDGIILIEQCKGFDFYMHYYNADGSEATFCGNGARCSVAWAFMHISDRHKFVFKAPDGAHEGLVLHAGHNQFTIQVSLKNTSIPVELPIGWFVDTGTPHLVVFSKAVNEADVLNEGRRLRYDSRFLPLGVNVDFVEESDGLLSIRTYEKGVENETLSCGTGVTASALAWAAKNGVSAFEKDVKTRGGMLTVKAQYNYDQFVHVMLIGGAVKVFEGSVLL